MTPRLATLALSALLAGCGQAWSQPAGEDTGPAFSLWSSQIFTTSDQPAFSLTYRGLDHLDFRVYRVADPVAFFGSLKDPHQLGSEKPVVPQERSWIERHVFESTSFRAFGREAGCDPRTAKRRLQSHLDKLRQAYEEEPLANS